MTWRDKIEKSLLVFFLGTLLTGFLAGVGGFQAVVSISGQLIVSKDRIARLEKAEKELAEAEPPGNCRVDAQEMEEVRKAIDALDTAWRKVNESNIGYYSNYADPQGQARHGAALGERKPVLENARMKVTRMISGVIAGSCN